MKHIYFLLISSFFCFSTGISQDFLSNNSGLVSIKDGAFLSVVGDIYIENNGVFDNSDTIFFTNDWYNNAGNTGFSSIGEGYVYLIGDEQHIAGTDETHYYNLLLRNSGIKYGDLDVYVDGFLDLSYLEFNMDTNVVYVTSPDLDATRNSTGFVSSLENGGISRVTNTNDVYLFPVGSSLYDTLYRPVEMTPSTANPHTYRVRFAYQDATFDGYNRDERALLICDINENYYHRIWQDVGIDSVDMRFYFRQVVDGEFNDVVHWEGIPQWERTPADTLVLGANWDYLDVTDWNDFSTPHFALAITTPPFADAGNDTTIFLMDTIQLNATGGIIYEWSPSDPLSCDDCDRPLFWDDTTRTLFVTVTNEKFCKDIDTLIVFVDDRFTEEGPFIPSGFSPNGDGINDNWYIRWLYQHPDNEVIIVNRWGDELFRSAPYENDWYGTWKGKNLPEGTYYYVLKLLENGVEDKVYTGPLTIIR